MVRHPRSVIRVPICLLTLRRWAEFSRAFSDINLNPGTLLVFLEFCPMLSLAEALAFR